MVLVFAAMVIMAMGLLLFLVFLGKNQLTYDEDGNPRGTPDRERIKRPLDAHIHCDLCNETVRTED